MDTQTPPKQVLVIDDDEALTISLMERLREAGYAASVAPDGETGLRDALGMRPDLIILDVVMPKMNGWDVLKALREDSWGKDAKVVMLTNSEDMDNLSQALAHGTTEYLIKGSWTLDDIIAKVQNLVG